MNLLKEVLEHEVYPALGCTEPTAVALASSQATHAVKWEAQHQITLEAAQLEIEAVEVALSPGAYKNAAGVTIPNTGGLKGCAIAAAIGAVCGNPNLGMQILGGLTFEGLALASKLVNEGKVKVVCNTELDHLYIKVQVKTTLGTGSIIVEGTHTNVVEVAVDGKRLRIPAFINAPNAMVNPVQEEPAFKQILKQSSIRDLITAAQEMDETDRAYILEGVTTNLAIAKEGSKLGGYGSFFTESLKEFDDKNSTMPVGERVRYSVKALVASATDARMGGVSLPVMSSGGSGNQGIVAILVPYEYGRLNEIDEKTVVESIALSHLINAFVKAYTGELAPICGCAIAAGLGAAVAIVYQRGEYEKIDLAINNMVASIAGMLCDGAKSGCTLKVVSSVDACLQAASLALKDKGATKTDGIIGNTPEETISNLGTLCHSMLPVDVSVIRIISGK